MDDVAGKVALPAGDEDLGAGDAEGAVPGLLRPGADDAEIRAGMGFGQVHRPRHSPE